MEGNITFDEDSCFIEVTGNQGFVILKRYVYNGILDNLAINAAVWFASIIFFLVAKGCHWCIIKCEGNESQSDHEGNGNHGSTESADSQGCIQSCCSWLWHFMRIREEDLIEKCGEDAMLYIKFQRYLLIYMLSVTICSMVTLVINFTGNNFKSSEFGRTLIVNLDAESKLVLWHKGIGTFYLVLAMAFMSHFSGKLPSYGDKHKSKTLMISGIPLEKRTETGITEYLMKWVVKEVNEPPDINVAYDVSHLMELDKKRNSAKKALEYCENCKRTVRTCYSCKCLCSCCRKIEDLAQAFKKEKDKAEKNLLGVAFVTLKDVSVAKRVLRQNKTCCLVSCLKRKETVSYAPSPYDIYWENLKFHGCCWWLYNIFIFGEIVFLLICFTTPAIIVSSLNKLSLQDFLEKTHNIYLVKFFPPLLLVILASLLPYLVYRAEKCMCHWTRSSEDHCAMVKTFIFLLLMVFILRSLGLTSVKALFVALVNNDKVKWKCIFVPANGAYFVNYVITSTFIGSCWRFLRVNGCVYGVLKYAVNYCMSKCSAEQKSLREHILKQEFQYGMQYAEFLCVFTIIMSYSLSCPVITPCGFVYMIVTHIADSQDLYFAYKKKHTSPGVHWSAINFVIVAVVFLQLNLFLTSLRGDESTILIVVSLAVLGLNFFMYWIYWIKVVARLQKWIQNRTARDRNSYENRTARDRNSYENRTARDRNSYERYVAGVLCGSQNSLVSDTATASSDTLARSSGTVDEREPHSFETMEMRNLNGDRQTRDNTGNIQESV